MKIIKSAIAFIVIGIMGVFFLVSAIKDKAELAKTPANIETMTESDYYNGRYVEGYIYELWNEYASLEESDSMFGIKYNTKTTGHYFAMPLETSYDTGIAKFASVSVRNSSDFITAQKMEQESLDFYNDEGDLVTKMYVKGKLTKLKGDGKKYFDEYIQAEGFSPSQTAVYYVINVGNDGSGTTIELIIGIAVTLVGVVGTLIAIMRGINRGY